MRKFHSAILGLLALCSLILVTPAQAQIKTIDPNIGLGAPTPTSSAPPATPSPVTTPPVSSDDPNADLPPPPATPQDGSTPVPDGTATPGNPNFPPPTTPVDSSDTYKKDDLIGAAEGVFGKGAEGLARIIEDVLKDQGQPNGYIVGREAGGALVVGVRYGSGKLMHKVEGEQDAYWTGPSVGFDAGANAAKTFVLVYNLYDTEDLYKRFPAGEGNAYFVGGFTASYLRRGDVVLIPIRLGVGVRLGANVGYMKFTKKQNWLPF
jgi:hypothetical protein